MTCETRVCIQTSPELTITILRRLGLSNSLAWSRFHKTMVGLRKDCNKLPWLNTGIKITENKGRKRPSVGKIQWLEWRQQQPSQMIHHTGELCMSNWASPQACLQAILTQLNLKITLTNHSQWHGVTNTGGLPVCLNPEMLPERGGGRPL